MSQEALLHWDRDYGVFAIIADVRNDIDEPYELAVPDAPRGLPESYFEGRAWRFNQETYGPDCEAMHDNHWPGDSDCHSHSWLTTDELVRAQSIFVKREGTHSNDMALAIILMRTLEQQGRKDVRLVFCFDN